MRIRFFLLLSLFAFGCGEGLSTEEAELEPTDEAAGLMEQESGLTRWTCTADERSRGGCFDETTWDGDWRYRRVRGTNAYYREDLAYTTDTYATFTWTFAPTTRAGEIWFSAFIPHFRATAEVFYTGSCRGPGGGAEFDHRLKGIRQIEKSGWTTLFNLGDWPAGTTCDVVLERQPTLDRNLAVRSMGADGMKMSIY